MTTSPQVPYRVTMTYVATHRSARPLVMRVNGKDDAHAVELAKSYARQKGYNTSNYEVTAVERLATTPPKEETC